MASPFKIFRKHQKFMIATLAILAMGAFVFLDPLMGILGGGGGGGPKEDAVLVRWDHGKLRESDLDRMVLTRRILNRFVQIAAQMGAEASGTTPQPHPGLGPETERDVVRTMLFTQAAEDAGFVISDGAVNRYIKQLTRNSVSSARLRQIILGTYINGQPVTMDVIFAALRTELLAQQFLGSYLIAADSVTPLERWITWLRINKRVSAELVPVSVQQFMNDVPAPADEELKAFYDQYKDVIKRPVIVDGTMMDSPDPGFKEPRRVTFEFVRADYDAVVDGIKPTITDAEIETYYNENKRNFVQPGLLEDEPAAEQRGPADREDPGTSPGDRKLDEPATGDVDSPAKADKTQEKEEPAKEEPAKEEPAKEEPAKEEPAKEEPADQSGSDGSASLREASSVRRIVNRRDSFGPFRFAAFEPESAAEGTAPIAPASSADRPTVEEATSDAPAAETASSEATGPKLDKPASESTVAPPSSAEAAEPAESSPSTTAASETDSSPDAGDATAKVEGGPRADTGSPGTTEPKDAEPNYAPLDQVRDQIRSELARRRAPEKMAEALKPLQSLIRRYHDDLMVWQVEEEDKAEGAPSKPRPTPPDAKAWAAEQSMTYEKTAPVSFFELNQMELGRSVVRAEGQPLATQAFTVLDEYQPVETEDFQGNRYLAWKIVETSERVHVLDEIRDKVVEAWKMTRARTMARKAADELAEKAKTKKGPLGDLFKDDPARKVIESDPFSWYTLGAVPGGRDVRVRISAVFGVDGAGPEFMRTVFSLDAGGVAVATNHAQTIVYVVRLASQAESDEALHARFLKEANLLEPMVRRQNQLEVITSLFRDLQETNHLEGWESLDSQRN